MANSKIIVVEGPQGSGKTTITDYLRDTLSSTNLYRLSGTSDSSIAGKEKAKEMYENLLDYTKKLENKSINLIFDRIFFSEENYCRLGKKDYSFTDVYEKLLDNFSNLDFEIYYINLYLSDINEYSRRLERDGKANVTYAKFSIENSIEQQKMYKKMSDELKAGCNKISVLNLDNTLSFENVKEILHTFIGY